MANLSSKAALQKRLARAFKKRNLYIASQACARHSFSQRMHIIGLYGIAVAKANARLNALKRGA